MLENNKIEDWIPFAKQHKENMVKSSSGGACPPAVIAEKDGRVQLIVVAPEVDKHLGLTAVALLHSSLDPDYITLIMDARMHSDKAKEGQTVEEAQAEFLKNYTPGSMQKKCEEGNRGNIIDCLVCYRIARDGTAIIKNIPYIYDGKDGPPFKWLDDDSEFQEKVNLISDNISGFIPDELKKIINLPVFNGEETAKLKMIADTFPPEERKERVYFHSARAIMAMLATKGYFIVDYISGTHPDWTGAHEKGSQVLAKMISDGFFPQEAFVPIKEIIDKHIVTKDFREKLTNLLIESSYWLPANIRADIPKFVLDFENMCIAPIMPKLDKNGDPVFDKNGNPVDADEPDDEPDDDEDNWDDDKDHYSSGPKSTIWGGNKKAKNRRVKVWNGDQSEYLGEGDYVDDVNVYFIRLEDGSIQSNHNAEIEPEPYQIPPGADIIKAGKNPKIVLDSGDTVYGCQVWWDFV